MQSDRFPELLFKLVVAQNETNKNMISKTIEN